MELENNSSNVDLYTISSILSNLSLNNEKNSNVITEIFLLGLETKIKKAEDLNAYYLKSLKDYYSESNFKTTVDNLKSKISESNYDLYDKFINDFIVDDPYHNYELLDHFVTYLNDQQYTFENEYKTLADDLISNEITQEEILEFYQNATSYFNDIFVFNLKIVYNDSIPNEELEDLYNELSSNKDIISQSLYDVSNFIIDLSSVISKERITEFQNAISSEEVNYEELTLLKNTIITSLKDSLPSEETFTNLALLLSIINSSTNYYDTIDNESLKTRYGKDLRDSIILILDLAADLDENEIETLLTINKSNSKEIIDFFVNYYVDLKTNNPTLFNNINSIKNDVIIDGLIKELLMYYAENNFYYEEQAYIKSIFIADIEYMLEIIKNSISTNYEILLNYTELSEDDIDLLLNNFIYSNSSNEFNIKETIEAFKKVDRSSEAILELLTKENIETMLKGSRALLINSYLNFLNTDTTNIIDESVIKPYVQLYDLYLNDLADVIYDYVVIMKDVKPELYDLLEVEFTYDDPYLNDYVYYQQLIINLLKSSGETNNSIIDRFIAVGTKVDALFTRIDALEADVEDTMFTENVKTTFKEMIYLLKVISEQAEEFKLEHTDLNLTKDLSNLTSEEQNEYLYNYLNYIFMIDFDLTGDSNETIIKSVDWPIEINDTIDMYYSFTNNSAEAELFECNIVITSISYWDSITGELKSIDCTETSNFFEISNSLIDFDNPIESNNPQVGLLKFKYINEITDLTDVPYCHINFDIIVNQIPTTE